MGGSMGGAQNAQKAFVQTVCRFCKPPYLGRGCRSLQEVSAGLRVVRLRRPAVYRAGQGGGELSGRVYREMCRIQENS